MIKIIINKNTLPSSLRNRLIVISSVPITRSSRRNRRSNMIWIKTTIDITTFWAKAIRFISFRNSETSSHSQGFTGNQFVKNCLWISRYWSGIRIFENLPWNSKLELLACWFQTPNQRCFCFPLEPLSIPHWRKLEYHWLMSIQTYLSSLNRWNLKCESNTIPHYLCDLSMTQFINYTKDGHSAYTF